MELHEVKALFVDAVFSPASVNDIRSSFDLNHLAEQQQKGNYPKIRLSSKYFAAVISGGGEEAFNALQTFFTNQGLASDPNILIALEELDTSDDTGKSDIKVIMPETIWRVLGVEPEKGQSSSRSI